MALRSSLARTLVRTFTGLGLRGAPTLLRGLAKLPFLRSVKGVARVGDRRVAFYAFDPYWAPYLWGGKTYEPDVEAILRKLSVIPDKLFVDCGANIGYWTVQVSDPAFGFSELIAVEANPNLIPLIRENLMLNGVRCEVIDAAIAEHTGETVYLGGTDQHASASVASSGIPVTTVSLATLLRDRRTEGRTTVAKLDVESFEVQAIKGAIGLEDRDIIYIVEDWPKSGMLCTSFLLARGYGVIGVAADGTAKQLHSVQEAIEFNAVTTSRYQPSNVIGCRKEKTEPLLRLLTGSDGALQ